MPRCSARTGIRLLEGDIARTFMTSVLNRQQLGMARPTVNAMPKIWNRDRYGG
jgi:hypothetical protein